MSRRAKSLGDICVEIKLTAFAFSKLHEVEKLLQFVVKILLLFTVNVLLVYPHEVNVMLALAGNIVVLHIAVHRHLSII